MAFRDRIKVWDPLLRAGHWLLVASVAAAWLTRHGGHERHEAIGYVTLAIVALRIVWGFAGPRYARFTQFIRPPAETARYGMQVLRGSEPRYLGHNPLGGWMILALLVMVVLVGASGWLFTTDEYWGVKWVEELHEGLSNLLLCLVALHVTGVVVESLRHREDLVGAMIHGSKRPPGSGDVA
jgi:cytochrome b